MLILASSSGLVSWSVFLTAISHFLWPGIAIYVLWRYRREIAELLKRVKLLRAAGTEVEFSAAVAEEYLATVGKNAEPAQTVPKETKPAADLPVHDIPGRFVLVWAKIEREVRRITRGSIRSGAPFAIMSRALPPHLRSVVEDLRPARNAIVHGEDVAVDQLETLVGIAENLLDGLRNTPVLVDEVTLYRDEKASQAIGDCHGVRIETTNNDDTRAYRVFPSKAHYDTTGAVSWEWQQPGILEPAWYRDPESNEVLQAFGQSLFFAGRYV